MLPGGFDETDSGREVVWFTVHCDGGALDRSPDAFGDEMGGFSVRFGEEDGEVVVPEAADDVLLAGDGADALSEGLDDPGRCPDLVVRPEVGEAIEVDEHDAPRPLISLSQRQGAFDLREPCLAGEHAGDRIGGGELVRRRLELDLIGDVALDGDEVAGITVGIEGGDGDLHPVFAPIGVGVLERALVWPPVHEGVLDPLAHLRLRPEAVFDVGYRADDVLGPISREGLPRGVHVHDLWAGLVEGRRLGNDDRLGDEIDDLPEWKLHAVEATHPQGAGSPTVSPTERSKAPGRVSNE